MHAASHSRTKIIKVLPIGYRFIFDRCEIEKKFHLCNTYLLTAFNYHKTSSQVGCSKLASHRKEILFWWHDWMQCFIDFAFLSSQDKNISLWFQFYVKVDNFINLGTSKSIACYFQIKVSVLSINHLLRRNKWQCNHKQIQDMLIKKLHRMIRFI